MSRPRAAPERCPTPESPRRGTNSRGLRWEERRICGIKVLPLFVWSQPCLEKKKQPQEPPAAQAGLSKQRSCSIPAQLHSPERGSFLGWIHPSHPFPSEIPVLLPHVAPSPQQPQREEISAGGFQGVLEIPGASSGVSALTHRAGKARERWEHPQGAPRSCPCPALTPSAPRVSPQPGPARPGASQVAEPSVSPLPPAN